MVKSFFLNESGFVAPWTALSGSWIAGILVGATTLFGFVSPALADAVCSDDCWGIEITLVCEGFDDCEFNCAEFGNVCICVGDCS